MNSPSVLRDELKGLKYAAEKKLWADQPKGYVTCRGWLLTCCIENGMLVLGVSLASTFPLKWDGSVDELLAAVVDVFGEPHATFEANYPNRGVTTLFQWRAAT